MDNKGPHETLKAELLADCNPIPIDDIYLKMIEDGEEQLSNDLFFRLIKESSAWLSTIPFQKKIAQWQYMLDNDMFEPDESKNAKKNLIRIGTVLAYEGQGRPKKVDDSIIYLRYYDLKNRITAFFRNNNIKSTSRLSALLKTYPAYKDCFDLKGKRHFNTAGEIAIMIMVKLNGWSERIIRAAISKNKSTKK